jgi:hypothetical protein
MNLTFKIFLLILSSCNAQKFEQKSYVYNDECNYLYKKAYEKFESNIRKNDNSIIDSSIYYIERAIECDTNAWTYYNFLSQILLFKKDFKASNLIYSKIILLTQGKREDFIMDKGILLYKLNVKDSALYFFKIAKNLIVEKLNESSYLSSFTEKEKKMVENALLTNHLVVLFLLNEKNEFEEYKIKYKDKIDPQTYETLINDLSHTSIIDFVNSFYP